MVRPVIYLDVDGVLNALHWRNEPPPDTWDDFEYHPNVNPDPEYYVNNECFNLWLSKKMVAAIVALDADVKWLTTWRECAPKTIAPLVDAPEWPYLEWYRSKAQALLADQENEPRPFIWIDDDVAEERYLPLLSPEWEEKFLLIRPDGRTGLLPEEVEQIAEWIEGLK